MTRAEIQREIEAVESAVEKNTDLKFVHGLIARGIWQVALQLAKLTRRLEETQ